MIGSIFSVILGLGLLVAGGFGLVSLQRLTAEHIPLIYGSLVMGVLLVTLGALSLRYRQRRHVLGTFSTTDGYLNVPVDGPGHHSISGHGGDCAHVDSGRGFGGDCGGHGVGH